MRIDLPLPITFSIADDKGSVARDILRSQTVDIGGGGLSFESHSPIEVQTRLKIEIILPSKTIKTVGQVRWSKEKMNGEKSYLLGSKFIRVKELDRSLLLQNVFV